MYETASGRGISRRLPEMWLHLGVRLCATIGDVFRLDHGGSKPITFCAGIAAALLLFLLVPPASGQNVVKVTGTIYIGSSNATRLGAKAYLMTEREYKIFIECAQNSTSAVPCFAKADPSFNSTVSDRGVFTFPAVPDGRFYYLAGLNLRTEHATTMQLLVAGDTEQDLFMR
jgi:hypothetical protein